MKLDEEIIFSMAAEYFKQMERDGFVILWKDGKLFPVREHPREVISIAEKEPGFDHTMDSMDFDERMMWESARVKPRAMVRTFQRRQWFHPSVGAVAVYEEIGRRPAVNLGPYR